MKTLIATASTSAVCFVEARNAFKRSYGAAKFYIEGPLVTGDDSITETNKQIIHIKNVEAAVNALKLFGDMIRFVEFSFADLDETNAATLAATVVENCANSLIELQLKSCFGSILDNLQKPFPNVNVTVFSTHSTTALTIGTNTWKLDRLFPNAKHLSVDIANVDYWKVVGDALPQLKVLTVVHPKPTYSAAIDIASLLNNSRSINSLTVYYSTLALLQTASEVLPQLNVLELNDFADDFYTGSDITFQNVSNLRIATTTNNAQVPEKLSFSGVKSLTLSLGFEFTDEWHQFVQKTNQNVQLLNLKTTTIKTDELKTIAHESAQLKLATIVSTQKVPTTEIVSFLEHSPKLEWLIVECALIDTGDRNVLEGLVEQTWLMEYLALTDSSNSMRFTR